MNLEKELEQFGLSDNEAKAYLACLSLGGASIQRIAQKAKLNRVTLYGIVEHLIERGFLHEEFNGKKKHIAAYPPMKLYDVLTREFDSVKRKERQLTHLVPALKGIQHADVGKTNVIYYEGEEGLKNWASDALETKGELLEWTKIESYTKPFNDYITSYYFPEKSKRKIPTRFIFLDTPEAHAYVEERYMKKGAPPMKARFISRDQFDTPGFTVIFNDRYSIALPKEMRAVTIVDQMIADAQRKIWEFGWFHARGELSNGGYPL